MTSRRPKSPERVIETVLNEASKLAVEKGIQTLTLQAVATAAGVTKSGLMHHFPTKADLISALCDRAIDHFSAALAKRMEHEVGQGRFTRAYVNVCLQTARQQGDLSLVTTLWADPRLRTAWYVWLADQENLHAETDGEVRFKILRLAADGAWLAMLDTADPEPWEAELIALASD